MSIVLYRKYRPQTFGEIIGQEHVVKTLTNSIKGKNISHAYLFAGPRGSGKTTIARLFAKAVNCESPKDGFEPCNKCSSCLEIMQGNSIDLIEIDAASHTGVDDVRELTEGIKFSPIKSKYKIFIIDECHQLSKSAANALLKTLEEPPAHAIFLLATTEPHKIIPTILSRCQRFDFRRLQSQEIIRKLETIAKKENVKFDEGALSLIAFNAHGSFRDAESLLDECVSFSGTTGGLVKAEDIKELLGIVEAGEISKFLDFIILKNLTGAIEFLNLMADSGVDLQEFAKALVFYARQQMLLKINPELLNPANSGFSAQELEKIKSQSENLKLEELQKMLEIFIEAENKIKYASISQLPLELAVITILNQEK